MSKTKNDLLDALAPTSEAKTDDAPETKPEFAADAPVDAPAGDAPSTPDEPAPARPEGFETIEHWAKALKTPAWLFAGAKLGNRWALGQEMTEEKYREAIDAAAKVECR